MVAAAMLFGTLLCDQTQSAKTALTMQPQHLKTPGQDPVLEHRLISWGQPDPAVQVPGQPCP